MRNYSLHLRPMQNGLYRLCVRGADLSGAWWEEVAGPISYENALLLEEASRGTIKLHEPPTEAA